MYGTAAARSLSIPKYSKEWEEIHIQVRLLHPFPRPAVLRHMDQERNSASFHPMHDICFPSLHVHPAYGRDLK